MARTKRIVVEVRRFGKDMSMSVERLNLRIALPTRAQRQGIERLLEWERRSANKDETVVGRV